MKELFEHMNYREYLADFYADKKERHACYSYRLFARKAGFKSPNFLKLVIEGRRNLSKDSVFRFCKALGLNKREAEYFENLVFFNQSKTLEEKNAYLANLMKYRGCADPKYIERSEYAYFSNWYHPVVRELVTSIDFRDDYRKLGRATIPSITAGEARQSVALLLELGFVERTSTGAYQKTSPSLTTGGQVRSVAVANYHKAMMRLGSESIERFGAGERDVESVTLNVSEQTHQAIMEKANAFLMEMLKLAETDRKNERVIQVNLQVFPLSRRIEG
ncbi:MAG: TIGR02147 family protein [Chitinivibrionales bacterium]|nr:TIGR02147 family protein [Chitinivibrionales bacterium]MBD3356475.1 TIGR02147 family protein [Chitinivibrionales bacterium]